jgi:predicted transcriptional regulator
LGINIIIGMPKNRFDACLSNYNNVVVADILAELEKESPLTITAVSVRSNLHWRTAKKRLLELVEEGKVVLKEIEGGTKLFSLNPDFKKGER